MALNCNISSVKLPAIFLYYTPPIYGEVVRVDTLELTGLLRQTMASTTHHGKDGLEINRHYENIMSRNLLGSWALLTRILCLRAKT